jgi:DNA-binding winged helix-turn-helix (wHTH) protein
MEDGEVQQLYQIYRTRRSIDDTYTTSHMMATVANEGYYIHLTSSKKD